MQENSRNLGRISKSHTATVWLRKIGQKALLWYDALKKVSRKEMNEWLYPFGVAGLKRDASRWVSLAWGRQGRKRSSLKSSSTKCSGTQKSSFTTTSSRRPHPTAQTIQPSNPRQRQVWTPTYFPVWFLDRKSSAWRANKWPTPHVREDTVPRSQTLHRLFELTQCPSRALNLFLYVASRISEIHGHPQVYCNNIWCPWTVGHC